MEFEYPILLFDGYCNLCSGSVVFILKRERKDSLRFASLQSDFAWDLLRRKDVEGNIPDSIVLYENNRFYYRSSAALRVSRYLKWPWPMFFAFMIVPKFMRDWVYDGMARKRYKWFGRRDECFVPGKVMGYKFLDN